MKPKKESFFWTSYSDLMTSLFFIMLVLFVLTIALMKHNARATEQELAKIKEINKSIENIDSSYFEYNPEFKRHTLKNIVVTFDVGDADIYKMSSSLTLKQLKEAGYAIRQFMKNARDSIPEANYLLIVEGQSSKDNYQYNDELSYKRALSLVNFWRNEDITFSDLPCELIVSGSGTKSTFRELPEVLNGKGNPANQRFVIHIIPKPGII